MYHRRLLQDRQRLGAGHNVRYCRTARERRRFPAVVVAARSQPTLGLLAGLLGLAASPVEVNPPVGADSKRFVTMESDCRCVDQLGRGRLAQSWSLAFAGPSFARLTLGVNEGTECPRP
jgi:hypothetical protein